VPSVATKLLNFLKTRLGFLEERFTQHQARKKLRLRETLSLGEKRFLAIVEYRHQELLVAGTASSITVLATSSSSSLDGVLGEEGCTSKDSVQ
jgi:flagellar biogenesis protein FliO